jgi:hypothetical protein
MELMKMSKTHYKQLMNPDYFGAYALPDGKDLTVTIKSVSRKTLTMTGGKKEEHSVCELIGHKPLILNATNSKTIAKLYGPYVEEWAGKQITMFGSTTKFGGDIVECVRIRPAAPSNAKQQSKTLTDARLYQAIAAIKAGNYKREQLNQYDLTAEQTKRITEELGNG